MVRRMSENKEFKETDIGCVPREWDLCNFGENSKIKARIGWQGLTTKEYKNSGDYFLITGTDFENNNIKWETCHYVDKFRYDQDVNIQVKDNDILITKDGTIGKVAFVDNMIKPATLNSGVFVIRPINSCYEPKFLFYVLKSFYFDKFLKQLTAGSTINHLYQKDIVKFNFVCPSIEEQKAIATALSDMDNLILSLEKLIDKKKMIKEGAMEELLTGKRRLNGFSDKWVERKLDDIVDFTNGKAHENNLVDYGEFIVVNSKFISTCGYVKKYTNEPSCIAQKNDILMVMSDVPNGKAIAKCFIVTEDNKYTVNQRICKLTVKEGYHKYLFYRINRNKYYLSFDDGAKQTNLRRADVLSLKLMLPEYKEQKAIATILSDMDNEIEKLKKKLDKYKKIKAGMMEQLLTGKRRLV